MRTANIINCRFSKGFVAIFFHEKNLSEIVIEFLVFNIAKSTTYVQDVVSHCLTGYVLQRVSLLSSEIWRLSFKLLGAHPKARIIIY